MPDTLTFGALQTVCKDATGATTCPTGVTGKASITQIITDLNTVELDRLYYRANWPDSATPSDPNPHTPVIDDAVLLQTGLALHELQKNNPNLATVVGYLQAAYPYSQANSTSDPPPYNGKAYAACEKLIHVLKGKSPLKKH